MSFDLRAERMNRGLTAAALAKELKVSRQTVMRIEAGAKPHAPTALKIAEWIAKDTGEETRPSDLWPAVAA